MVKKRNEKKCESEKTSNNNNEWKLSTKKNEIQLPDVYDMSWRVHVDFKDSFRIPSPQVLSSQLTRQKAISSILRSRIHQKKHERAVAANSVMRKSYKHEELRVVDNSDNGRLCDSIIEIVKILYKKITEESNQYRVDELSKREKELREKKSVKEKEYRQLVVKLKQRSKLKNSVNTTTVKPKIEENIEPNKNLIVENNSGQRGEKLDSPGKLKTEDKSLYNQDDMKMKSRYDNRFASGNSHSDRNYQGQQPFRKSNSQVSYQQNFGYSHNKEKMPYQYNKDKNKNQMYSYEKEKAPYQSYDKYELDTKDGHSYAYDKDKNLHSSYERDEVPLYPYEKDQTNSPYSYDREDMNDKAYYRNQSPRSGLHRSDNRSQIYPPYSTRKQDSDFRQMNRKRQTYDNRNATFTERPTKRMNRYDYPEGQRSFDNYENPSYPRLSSSGSNFSQSHSYHYDPVDPRDPRDTRDMFPVDSKYYISNSYEDPKYSSGKSSYDSPKYPSKYENKPRYNEISANVDIPGYRNNYRPSTPNYHTRRNNFRDTRPYDHNDYLGTRDNRSYNQNEKYY
jgi:hypothetical protein